MGLFAPHGWASIGHAAAILMLSFVGWEATAPLTPRLRDPARQLPRVIAIALATTTALYLGLAVTTIAVLGHGAGTDVPLADLLRYAIGPAGRAAAAVAAVVLTLGATNAYLTGASAMAVDLTRHPGQQRHRRPARPFLALIAAAGLLIIGLYSLRLVTTTQLVTLPTTLFLAVYLGCTISAARTLVGRARYAAMPALAAVIVVLLFSGWALAITAAVAATAALAAPSRAERNPTAMPGGNTGSSPCAIQCAPESGQSGWPRCSRTRSSTHSSTPASPIRARLVEVCHRQPAAGGKQHLYAPARGHAGWHVGGLGSGSSRLSFPPATSLRSAFTGTMNVLAGTPAPPRQRRKLAALVNPAPAVPGRSLTAAPSR